MSDRALFYHPILPGSVFFLDDVQGVLSDILQATMKQATSQFQAGFDYITLDKNKNPRKLHIPPRCTWWLTSVDNSFQDQVINRQLMVTVEDSPEHRAAIRDFILRRAMTGEPSKPLDDDVRVVRMVLRLILSEPVLVDVPYASHIVIHRDDNTRNLNMFVDTIRAFASLRRERRERTAEGHVVASEDDFRDAAMLWAKIAESQVSKLTKQEIAAAQYIKKCGIEGCDVNEIAGYLKLSPARAREIVNELQKKITMEVDDITETTHGESKSRGRKRNIYRIKNLDVFENFESFVSLRPEEVRA